jgi:hypothetical protein
MSDQQLPLFTYLNIGLVVSVYQCLLAKDPCSAHTVATSAVLWALRQWSHSSLAGWGFLATGKPVLPGARQGWGPRHDDGLCLVTTESPPGRAQGCWLERWDLWAARPKPFPLCVSCRWQHNEPPIGLAVTVSDWEAMA